MTFLPVRVPGGPNNTIVYVVPEDVIAVYATSAGNATIMFRSNHMPLNLEASLDQVMSALLCTPRAHCQDLQRRVP